MYETFKIKTASDNSPPGVLPGGDDSLKNIYNSYKFVIINNIKETQETRHNTVQSIKKVNESRTTSRVSSRASSRASRASPNIEMKTFQNTEPLLF